MLGMDFPGGPAIDRAARQGNPKAIPFPRFHQRKNNLEFSFSGLKTSLLYKLRDLRTPLTHEQTADLAASYQEAIVQALVEKAFTAVAQSGLTALAVVGGVSANSRLRTLLRERAEQEHVHLSLPPMGFCTDNAAMIAASGRQMLLSGAQASRNLDIQPSLHMNPSMRTPSAKELSHS